MLGRISPKGQRPKGASPVGDNIGYCAGTLAGYAWAWRVQGISGGIMTGYVWSASGGIGLRRPNADVELSRVTG
jgi:hypothetical protein